MKNVKWLSLVVVPALVVGCLGDATSVQTRPEETELTNAELTTADVEIRISPSTDVGDISPHIFGTNLLYWVDDDQALADGSVLTALRGAQVGMLRFPGGTVANNYDWATNQLEDPTVFPHSPDPEADAVSRTDYREFLGLVRQLPQARGNLVVNVEGAYRQTPAVVGRYAQKAADWVRSVNVTMGAGIKHWEIGNEEYFPYWPGLSAREYAASVVTFSKAMKAVDPTVKIGAVGPFSSSGVGFGDRLTASGKTRFRAMTPEEIKTHLEEFGSEEAFARWLNGGSVVSTSPWWEVVAREAGDHFDFIVTHRYDATRSGGDFTREVTTAQTIGEIRATVSAQHPGWPQVAMTEWNVAGESVMEPHEHVVAMAEQLTHMLRSRLLFANYWPLRSKNSPFTLMTMEGAKKDSLEVFGAIARATEPNLIPSEVTLGTKVDVVASAKWKSSTSDVRRTVLVVNRSRVSQQARVVNLPGALDRAIQFYAVDGDTRSLGISPARSGDNLVLTLRPLSITLLQTIGN
jgi:hypothetical protein